MERGALQVVGALRQDGGICTSYLGGRRSEGWEDRFLVGRTVGVTRNACEGLRETRQLGTKDSRGM